MSIVNKSSYYVEIILTCNFEHEITFLHIPHHIRRYISVVMDYSNNSPIITTVMVALALSIGLVTVHVYVPPSFALASLMV